MAELKKNTPDFESLPSGKGLSFGIIVAEWHEDVTSLLLDACNSTLKLHDVVEEDIHIVRVPGSYELPLGARLLNNVKKLDAIICLGCLIKGETKHDEYIANAVSSGIMQLSLMISVPVIFGVLTTQNKEQALERAGGKHGNKGMEAAASALKMVAMKKALYPKQKIGFGQ